MANHLNEGWIKIYRSLKDKAYYRKDSEKVHLWIHLLIKASFSKNKETLLGGKPYLCHPGEFTTGRRQLSLETGINENKIERILSYFEKIEQQIEQRKTSKNRLIIIRNWNLYQQCEHHFEQRVNNDRTTSEQRVNTSLKCKERKNVRKKECIKDILSDEPDEIPYKSIIDYLNLKLNTKYKHTSKKNRCLIHARWDEGYREEDFKYVIDIKIAAWFKDKKMCKYLRPETLFSNKFESYRNEKVACKQPGLLKYLIESGELDEEEISRNNE